MLLVSHAGLLRLHILLSTIVGGLVVIWGRSLDPWFESGGGAVVTGGLVTGGRVTNEK